MSKFQLYIDGQLADTNESDSILFVKQRTDYTNPTIVKNSFTKTVKLPGTNTNNQIFNNIWKLDRIQWSNAFNASKRTPFLLLKDGNLVEKGYLKLDKIVWDGTFYTYETTLYGELGNLLYKLKYYPDPDTDEQIPMTLADLSFGYTSFQISRDLVEEAWLRINGSTSASAMFDTINFMVSYDGVPSCNNFDTKKCWCSVTRNAPVKWNDTSYTYNNFPDSYTDTESGTTYWYVSSMLSRMDPDDHYGLLDLKNDMTPLETRDLRCYLLRPVIKVKKIFEAISSYLNTELGYTLDMTDPFFSTTEFTNTWMTLSMLYEINPDVQSYTTFTFEQLLSNTSAPSDYLISYCKIYGIYIDVDLTAKTIKLSRLPNFFQDKVNELKIDKGKEIKITPLSFDKASYTFDYGEGEGYFLKSYNETYSTQYGSKKVNTGYRFDAESSPYIDNNIFKEAVDSIDQSIYYRYPAAVRSSGSTQTFLCYPQALTDEANLPTYTLFNQSDTTDTYGAEMSMINTNITIGSGRFSTKEMGYQFQGEQWLGLRQNVWQDGFPKLQFHDESGKGTDGKDVLVQFGGFYQVQYGSGYYNERFQVYREQTSDHPYVEYLLSDDSDALKLIIGKNCYYDNPNPQSGYGHNYISQRNTLPLFTRATYTLDASSSLYPAIYTKKFYNLSPAASDSYVTVTSPSDFYMQTVVTAGDGGHYSYITTTIPDATHIYFLVSCVSTDQATEILSGRSGHPNLIGSNVIDYMEISSSSSQQLAGSLVTGVSGSRRFCPLTVTDNDYTVTVKTYYMLCYDLTAMGLDTVLTTVEAAIAYFGLEPNRTGYPYFISDTLDFSIPVEIYVPGCYTKAGAGIYNDYWADYILDVYSVNTKVIECWCYIDNINEAFAEFYHYDNALWILSKITDWNIDTHKGKGTFIKVNDKDNYLA